MKRFTALTIALWLGMQIGFYVASLVLFNQLDKVDAGRIAGILFHINNLLGLGTWVLAWLMCRQRQTYGSWDNHQHRSNKTRVWIFIMLMLIACAEFMINPVIQALKHQQSHVLVNLLGGTFGHWHGASYVLHLIISLLGLGLSIRLLRLAND